MKFYIDKKHKSDIVQLGIEILAHYWKLNWWCQPKSKSWCSFKCSRADFHSSFEVGVSYIVVHQLMFCCMEVLTVQQDLIS